jgi:hypothetical protein
MIADSTSASSGLTTSRRSWSVFDGANAGGAQDFHGRPCPEGVLFLADEVAAFAGDRVVGPDHAGSRSGRARASECLPVDVELLAGRGLGGDGEQPGGRVAMFVDTADQDGQHG